MIETNFQKDLNTKVIGRNVHYFDEIASTSEEAKKMLERAGGKEGDVIIAKKQTKGRGRFERGWFSPAGGIYLSVILKPRINQEDLLFVTFLGAISVIRTIKKLANITSNLKWPNDVMIAKKKISGILTEKRGDAVVIGIGVNVNIPQENFDEELKESATSLLIEVKKQIDINEFLKSLLEELDSLYNLFLFGGKESIIREHGELIIELPHGKITKLKSGDVL